MIWFAASLFRQDGQVAPLSVGGSGALQLHNGELDIVPSVVPRLGSFNTFTGLNSFTYLRLVPNSSGQPMVCNAGQDALGMLWFDASNPQTSHLKLCAMTAGKADWVQLR
jgi:hypothetical protein